jgi:hypothetical protein
MSMLDRLFNQLRYGLLTRSVLLRLQRIGIDCMPYILYREGTVQALGDVLGSEYQIERIRPDDVQYIADNFPNADFTAEGWRQRLADRQLGLLVRCGKEMVGYTWADVKECGLGPGKLLFRLAAHQAYLRYTFITNSYRGRALAPALRRRIYEEMAQAGKTELFSVSEYFNTPAKNFKKKLGAVPLELRISVKLFRRWGLDLRLARQGARHAAHERFVPRLRFL